MDPIPHTCSGILIGQGLRPLPVLLRTTLSNNKSVPFFCPIINLSRFSVPKVRVPVGDAVAGRVLRGLIVNDKTQLVRN